MIDMVFQLVAFFIMIMNFSEVEKSADIQLPLSTIVKPPEVIPPYKIILNVEDTGMIKFGTFPSVQLNAIRPILIREVGAASRLNVPPEKISVIIRADMNVKTGLVQELMDACKNEKLESFSMRVLESLRK
jgi:biopolymer transport protein ExbD